MKQNQGLKGLKGSRLLRDYYCGIEVQVTLLTLDLFMNNKGEMVRLKNAREYAQVIS